MMHKATFSYPCSTNVIWAAVLAAGPDVRWWLHTRGERSLPAAFMLGEALHLFLSPGSRARFRLAALNLTDWLICLLCDII